MPFFFFSFGFSLATLFAPVKGTFILVIFPAKSSTPPKLKVSYENPAFSPNNDGVKESVIFFPFLLEPDRIQKWNFYIYDEDGNIVRNVEGSGDLPKGWAWHGENDHFNGVRDGIYFFQCVARDVAGNLTTTNPIKVVIDRSPPKISVSFASEQNGIICRILSRDESGINNWFFSILDKADNIYKLYEGENNALFNTIVVRRENRIFIRDFQFRWSIIYC